jgi:feruloyl esterase
MEAQRYPSDFEGIIAGALAFNQAAPNAMEEPYESTADENAAGSPILTAADTTVLHGFIIAQCADPALHDGTIQDPNDCHPNWSKVQCSATLTSECLTAAEVQRPRTAGARLICAAARGIRRAERGLSGGC